MLTVTTFSDESFDSLDFAGESADGAGLSLREAIGLIGSGSTNPITFSTGGAANLSLGRLFIAVDTTIDGDIDNDLNFDVSIVNTDGDPTIELGVDGVSFTNDGGRIFTDASGTSNEFGIGVLVSADNVSFTNSGVVDVVSFVDFLGDRGSAIHYAGDNFSLVNNGVIDVAARWAIEVDFSSGATGVDIVNTGVLEGADDAIRMGAGTVTNSGTIRSSGDYAVGGDPMQIGFISDGISVGIVSTTGLVMPANGAVTIDNLTGGLIEGFRSGIFSNFSGTINNDGTIRGEGAGIAINGDASGASSFTLNNSGLVERLGGPTELGFFSALPLAGLVVSDFFITSAAIDNSGEISSIDTAIRSSVATSINNQAAGVIRGDSDLMGGDAVAFRGEVETDFAVTAAIGFEFVDANLTFVSAQAITFDPFFGPNGGLVTSVGTYALPSFIELGYLSVDAPPILPLVDLTATQSGAFLVFQADPMSGSLLYPASIIVPTNSFGDATVDYFNGVFTVTDGSGAPILDIPPGVILNDVITNAGLIIGDVITGMGADSVSGAGEIRGAVFLGSGNDAFDAALSGFAFQVFGDDGKETILAGAGADTLDGGSGNDTIDGGAGNDLILAQSGRDSVLGGAGDDSVDAAAGDDTVDGGANNDRIFGGTGYDLLSGGNGNDTIQGGTENDTLTGGKGFDYLLGQDGNDSLVGDDLADTLVGGNGRDYLNGGIDNDRLLGEAQQDTIFGDAGDDIIDAGTGNDVVDGGGQRDSVFGGSGFDLIDGGAGNDTLTGGTDGDTLNGGAGFDVLQGDAGDDVLNGGASNDVIFGNAGNDTIIFEKGGGTDTLRDFTSGAASEDVINLVGFGPAFDTFGEVIAAATQTGAHVTIDFGGGDMLVIRNTLVASLHADDFSFG